MSRQSIFLLFFILIFSKSQAQNSIPASIDTQRFGATELLWDLKKLSVPPAFSWLDSTSAVRALTYESVPFAGKSTRVFAYYSNPDLLMGRNTGRKFPGVVLVHGGGGAAFKEWVEKWAADGYAAIAMDLGGKGIAGPLPMGGPDQTHELKFTAIEKGNLRDVWSYHAVASVILAHSLLLSRREVNSKKTTLTGISWGGYLTCMVAGLDNRFKAAVPVYGCGYYDESDVFGKDVAQLSSQGKANWMKYFDPSTYLPFARPSLLFVNGNKDRFYNMVPYYKTYNLPQQAEKNICLKPDMKHSHVSGWEPIEIRYFFESVLNDGVPLPKLDAVKQAGSTVRTTYNATVGLRSAQFYYSRDTTSINEKRDWASVEAKTDPTHKTLTAEVPEANFAYGFFYVTDHREVSVSSPIWVK
jgi:dienelactone hydrolase